MYEFHGKAACSSRNHVLFIIEPKIVHYVSRSHTKYISTYEASILLPRCISVRARTRMKIHVVSHFVATCLLRRVSQYAIHRIKVSEITTLKIKAQLLTLWYKDASHYPVPRYVGTVVSTKFIIQAGVLRSFNPANTNQTVGCFTGVYAFELYWYRLELSVTTTYLTTPPSSLHGVQCVKNLSSPRRARDRRVKRLMLAEIAWPPFSASLTFDLNSRGKEVVYWAKNLKMLFPMKSLLVLLVIPRTSTMPCE